MAVLHLAPPLQIRALQKGLAEERWTATDLGLGEEADLFSIPEATWLAAYAAMDLGGRISDDFKQAILDIDRDATQFLESKSHARSYPQSARARYEPLGFLGDGGMGSVYKVYDQQLGRLVALKFLKHLDDDARQRFLQETRAHAQIEHPNIVQIFEAGEFDGTPYLAMQFVDGPTLLQAIPSLNLEQKVRIIRDAAEALHACHRQGILHRDIKPSNIMLDPTEDGHWQAFVMDFGLARVTAEESRTQVGFLLGTPAYLSPEQAAGQPFDRRSDIYALGTSLYECIAGAPPFAAAETWDLLRKIVTEEPPSLRTMAPSLPRDLELIIAKAMDKDPLRRYASARGLADDLTRFLEGDPVQAQPATLRYKAWKALRKHRGMAWVSGVSVLLVALIGAWALRSSWQTRRAAEATQSFGAEAEGMEGLLYKSYSLPLHDTRLERAMIHTRLQALGLDMARQGQWAQGAGYFALGRGHLALGELERARMNLEQARQFLPTDPRVAQALGLTLAHLYAQELEGLQGRAREERKQEVERTLKAPALGLLQEAGARGLEAQPFVAAMVALVEERYEEVSAKAKLAQAQAPWNFQAWVLEGRAHREIAADLLAKGQFNEALAALDQAGWAFEEASNRARSAPEPYLAEAQRRLTLLRIRFDRGQPGKEDKAWALEAVRKARIVDPEGWQAYQFASGIHRQWALQLLGQGQPAFEDLDASVDEARKGLQSNPGNVGLLINLASALRTRAYEEFDRGLDPRTSLKAAEAALEQALSQPRFREFLLDGLGNCHLVEAVFALHHGLDPTASVERSARALEESNALHPWVGHLSSLGEVLTTLAQYQRWQGMDPLPTLRRAEAAFQQALALNRNSFQARLARAEAQAQEAQWLVEQSRDATQALAALRAEATEAFRLNASLAESWALQSLAALTEAQAVGARKDAAVPLLQAAETHLKRAQALSRPPKRAARIAAELALARVHLQHRQGALTPALQAIDRALQTQPAEAQLWFLKARLLEASGRRSEAGAAYEEAFRRNANLRLLRDRAKAGVS
jgi:serine/threonine-protein kinase